MNHRRFTYLSGFSAILGLCVLSGAPGREYVLVALAVLWCWMVWEVGRD